MSKLDDLKARLAQYRAAETAILTGAQSYKIGSMEVNRANLSHIREEIERLEAKVAKEESRLSGRGPRRSFGIIPRDF
jgi:hypothetical protein